MKEVFLLKAGKREMWEYGDSVSVLKNGDFFKIRDFIQAGILFEGESDVIMLHSHPVGFNQFSQADTDTLIGLRLGLGLNFIAGIVFLNGKNETRYRLFDIRLKSKKVEIKEVGVIRNFVLGVWFNLHPILQKIRQLSQYEQ